MEQPKPAPRAALRAYLLQMSTLVRLLLILVWAAFMVGMANWSYTDGAMAGAAIGTLALGLLVGRWWVPLVPLVAGTALALATLVSDPENFHENTPVLWAGYVMMWTLAISVLIAVGVALNRVIERAGRRRNGGLRTV